MKAALVFWNRSSGATPHTEKELQAALHSAGVPAELRPLDKSKPAQDQVRAAMNTMPSIFVAAGGDGTVSAVASVIAGTGNVMGVLPVGTLNHFAKDCGIPVELDEAAHVLGAGHDLAIDVAEVNGRVFVNNSSLGIYPLLVEEREQGQKRGQRKWPAFFSAMLRVGARHPFVQVTIEADNKKITRKTPFVFIGNNEYEVAALDGRHRKSLTGGLLCVYVARRTGRWGLVRLAMAALLGRLEHTRDCDAFKTAELTIHTKRKKAKVSADGEVLRLEAPLHYRIRPRALRVLVPE